MKKCALCKGQLKAAQVSHAITMGDEIVTLEVPARLCAACDESFVEAKALQLAEGKVALAIVDSGAPTAARIRFLRKFMAQPANRLAELLGVQPETLSRWETGKRAIDGLAWFALLQLVRDHIAGKKVAENTLLRVAQPIPGPLHLRA